MGRVIYQSEALSVVIWTTIKFFNSLTVSRKTGSNFLIFISISSWFMLNSNNEKLGLSKYNWFLEFLGPFWESKTSKKFKNLAEKISLILKTFFFLVFFKIMVGTLCANCTVTGYPCLNVVTFEFLTSRRWCSCSSWCVGWRTSV